MLEVSLPEHIIKFYKLTCRNYTYFDDGTLHAIITYKKGEYYGNVYFYKYYEDMYIIEEYVHYHGPLFKRVDT